MFSVSLIDGLSIASEPGKSRHKAPQAAEATQEVFDLELELLARCRFHQKRVTRKNGFTLASPRSKHQTHVAKSEGYTPISQIAPNK
jgi:hypothetical protein